jgi:DNA-binding transcriptional MocR family regulator
MKATNEDFLYHQVAERLEGLITGGVLKSGERMLSVRALSEEQGISLSTAFKAYSALESKGLVEARPKSGYYVRFSSRKMPRMVVPAMEVETRRPFTVDEMIGAVYANLAATDVVQLSIAAPSIDLLPAPRLNKCLLEALRESPTSCLHYEHIQGNERLRRQIARLSFNWNGRAGESDVIVTNGCMEALSLCLQAVTRPGDLVAIERPTYFGIFNLLKHLNLRPLEIPSHPETGPDLAFLQSALESDQCPKACVFVPNFNNPMGSMLPDEQKQALVRMLAARNIPLVEDDIYGDVYFGKTRPRTCKTYDTEGLVLYCSSFSKSLAPGYRLGWCLPGRYLDVVRQLKLTHSISTATPTQMALARFCETGRLDLHLRHLRKVLRAQCLRYSQAIAEYFPEGVRVSRPQGGYVLWVELDRQIDAFELFRKAHQHHISISPGQIFSLGGQYSYFIRLGFGAPYSAKIDRSLKILGTLIREGT